ncbi:hypothetical protein HG536_0A06730 [Torulaspora globosa]|uniref:alcohol O-acetyltransferase n=1 Tax=Torulaspora globosa TaxID=48254 RepID=A0A7G3ZBH2_9SACH|nr:uncharacterized protein HG536_0A06730 [Torulaspora globosa]QLL30858.1 hypothetical protein HG536_0A06730 [Torulaspora globosa]
MPVSTLPVINPFNWGFNGTVKHVVGKNGTVQLYLKDEKERTDLEHFVSQNIPELKDGAQFRLNPLLFTGILQTVYLGVADFSQKFRVFYGREIVKYSDGGVSTADWVMNSWKNQYHFDEKTGRFDREKFDKDEEETHFDNWPRLHPRTRYMRQAEIEQVHSDDRPLIVVLHGLAGGSHEPVIRSLTDNLSRMGNGRFQVVVLNARGCARSKITTRSLFTALNTGDIEEFLNANKKRHPNRKIYAVGFSFGACMLANYLGRLGENTPLSAAVTLCNPWDMVLSTYKMRDDWWSRRLFTKSMVHFLTRMIKVNMGELEVPDGSKPDHKPSVENPSYYTCTRSNLEKAKHFDSVIEFDNLYTAPCLGFASALDYYKEASPVNRLPNIKIPTLIINSSDDPVVGSEAISHEQVSANPNVLLCETDLGGHLAYLDCENEPWVTKQIAAFFYKFDELVR